MAIHPDNLILITGATGHVGSATLLHLLRGGYAVRAAVRSESKAAQILARPSVQQILGTHKLNPHGSHQQQQQLTFAIVPDISAPGAYDEAVRGAVGVIHIASPLVTGDTVPLAEHDRFFIQPAVRGTLGMLEAARAAGTVRRVVVTSSIVALVTAARMEGTDGILDAPAVKPTDRVEHVDGPYTSEFAAYAASKVAALACAEDWIRRERPGFDVVYLHPSFVLGHNDGATNPAQAVRGTNAVVLAMLLGKTFGPYAGATVHVEDVASAHVAALSRVDVPGNRSYILSGPRATVWNDAKEIAARRFPEAVASRLLSMRGEVGTTPVAFDVALTERTFGMEFAEFEEQVVSTVAQFIDLRVQQKAAASRAAAAVRVQETLMEVRANA